MVYLDKCNLTVNNWLGRIYEMNKLKKTMHFIANLSFLLSVFLGYIFFSSVEALDCKTSKMLVEESSPSDFVVDEEGCLKSYNGYAEAVMIPGGVKSVPYGIFMGRTEIKAVIFPEGLISIDEYAFYGCNNICEVVLPESLQKLGRLAFGNCSKMEILYIGKGVESWGEFALLGCKNLSYISVNEDNTTYGCYDGILYDKKFERLICCPSGREGEVETHKNTITISSYAFFDCERIEKIIISDNLRYMDEAAFCGCKNLSEVCMGNNVKKIRSGCFQNCESLKEFIVSNSVQSVGTIAFFNCNSLMRITFLNSQTDIGEKIFSRGKNIVVRGYVGSSAEKYAKKYGYTFEKIN